VVPLGAVSLEGSACVPSSPLPLQSAPLFWRAVLAFLGVRALNPRPWPLNSTAGHTPTHMIRWPNRTPMNEDTVTRTTATAPQTPMPKTHACAQTTPMGGRQIPIAKNGSPLWTLLRSVRSATDVRVTPESGRCFQSRLGLLSGTSGHRGRSASVCCRHRTFRLDCSFKLSGLTNLLDSTRRQERGLLFSFALWSLLAASSFAGLGIRAVASVGVLAGPTR
jgi:hypothetical protein